MDDLLRLAEFDEAASLAGDGGHDGGAEFAGQRLGVDAEAERRHDAILARGYSDQVDRYEAQMEARETNRRAGR